MEIISRLPNSCIVRYKEKIYSVIDYFILDFDDWDQIRSICDLRYIENQADNALLSLQEIETIAKTTENIDPEIKDDIETEYQTIIYRINLMHEDEKYQVNNIERVNNKIVINNQIITIEEAYGKTICSGHHEWIIKRVIGIGGENIVFDIEPVNHKSTRKIAKFRKCEDFAGSIKNFLRLIDEETDEDLVQIMSDGGRIKDEFVVVLSKQLDQDQQDINDKFDMKSCRLEGGGILEEYMTGKTLTSWLVTNANNTSKKAIVFLKLLIEVLKINRRNIVHNDLNTDNILIEEDQEDIKLKLIDFGASIIPRKLERISSILTPYADQFKFSNGKFIPPKSDQKLSDFLANDIKRINMLAHHALSFKSQSLINNFLSASSEQIVNGIARKLAIVESQNVQNVLEQQSIASATEEYYDDDFWGKINNHINKYKNTAFSKQINNLLKIKAEILRQTTPRIINSTIFIISCFIIASLVTTETILAILNSSIAIYRNNITLSVHISIIASTILFFIYAIASNSDNEINLMIEEDDHPAFPDHLIRPSKMAVIVSEDDVTTTFTNNTYIPESPRRSPFRSPARSTVTDSINILAQTPGSEKSSQTFFQ